MLPAAYGPLSGAARGAWAGLIVVTFVIGALFHPGYPAGVQLAAAPCTRTYGRRARAS